MPVGGAGSSLVNVIEVGWQLAVLLVLLALIAAATVRVAELGSWHAPLTASARAVVQLTVVSLVIGIALESMLGTFAFIALMMTIATLTSCRRITGSLGRPAGWLSLAFLASLLPTLILILASTAIPLEPVSVLPVAGILVGGAMIATTLSGRRTSEELIAQHGPYEAALALGFTRRSAVGLIARPAAGLALVPGLDQTRTVGLVTLPGAFIGVLLGGATPAQAAAAQVLVLVALLAVQAVAAAVTVELIASGRVPLNGAPLQA